MSAPSYELLVGYVALDPDLWLDDDERPLPAGDNTLLTLAQAARVEFLGGHFSRRQLYGAADRMELQATLKCGRLYTTRNWLKDWINAPWHHASKTPAASGTLNAAPGASSTRESDFGSASLAMRLKKLSGG